MQGRMICIAGPTASGKTALSIALAKTLGGEIVSCDSMQVYRHLDIGSAKPTLSEREGIPHHMIDVCDPGEDFSVSRYCRMATPIVEDILARGRTAIVVGGTGLYMDALVKGNDFAPYPSTGRREELEKLAKEKGIQAVIDMLEKVDPESAMRLHPADEKRIIRAMEVYLETGKTITEHDRMTREQPPRFSPLWFGLDDEKRSTLYDRINRRVDGMLRDGLLDEIRELLAMGIPEGCTAMQAIGYKEYLGALRGACTVEEATELVKQASRRYAKRQLTWFRRNPHIHWLIRRETDTQEKILFRARQIISESDK